MSEIISQETCGNEGLDRAKHPCFNGEARKKTARVHLPVAPACNMQCRYCDRKFDCANESRPGVASKVLSPNQAMVYLTDFVNKMPQTAVAGIAGPGDPFANAEATLETLTRVRESYPEILLCVATNGLNLPPYIDALADLKTSHVTLTINGVDPEITCKIYSWMRHEKRMYRGIEAAELLLKQQETSVKMLKARGILVKVNMVIVKGVNDHHAEAVAKQVKEWGADIFNAIPLVHVKGTDFDETPVISGEEMSVIKAKVREILPLMGHCARCRADSAGLIGHDEDIQEMLEKASLPVSDPAKPYVAVASMEGIFVNSHLGDAPEFMIYGLKNEQLELVAKRPAPPAGLGQTRWEMLSEVLHDCQAVLTSGCGPSPQKYLENKGIRVIAMEGLLSEGVMAVLKGQDIPKMMQKKAGKCELGSCEGTGQGCG